MNGKDLNELIYFINKYGIFDIKKEVDINIQLLTYIYNTRFKDSICDKDNSFLYSEDNETVTFTNEKTSVFCVNKKLINLNLLVKNKAVGLSNSLLVKPKEIEKYFNKSRNLLGNSYNEISLANSDLKNIPINEYKLIKLLLDNAKISISSKNPIIYAENENGYAYVLGKRNGIQTKF